MDTRPDREPSRRPLPPDVAAVAHLDIRDVVAAVRMSASWVHAEVAAGRFPAPAIRAARCTRWRSEDIRRYLVDRVAQAQPAAAALVTERATRASAAAQAKRASRAAPKA